MWSHVIHSDSLMYWNTTATLLDTRGPVQGFLLCSPLVCLHGMLGKWGWSSTPTQLTSDH